VVPLPLEGVKDWVDIELVVNPWQAIVLCVLIFALLIWPSLSARSSAKRVEKSLTTNNGGSTTKDALDEIRRVQATIVATQEAHGEKLDTHITWSEGYVKGVGERLDKLEKHRGLFR
jgi:hypothetical protein